MVVDVLLREQRDTASAEAFFRQAIERTGVMPNEVVTDHHQPYVKAVATMCPGALQIPTGLHRADGETTRAVERSHVPTRDRLRNSRGLKRTETGQRFLEGFEAIRHLRRGGAPAAGHLVRAPAPHTRGGGHGMTVQERLAAALQAKPEMASLNMGSMNFGLFRMLERGRQWKYDWEPAYLEASRDFIFRNTFKDIEYTLRTLGEGCGTRFEFECYDVGHLYNLAHFVDRGLVRPPMLVQTIFGILGGIGADPDNLVHMKRVADKLFGDAYQWSVLAAGRHQMPLVTTAAILGGNVRVGLEDSLWLGRGQLAESNAAQVRKIRDILENLSLEIATADEARTLLHLKGADQVAF